jgi:hypothetical protein
MIFYDILLCRVVILFWRVGDSGFSFKIALNNGYLENYRARGVAGLLGLHGLRDKVMTAMYEGEVT